MIRNCPSCGKGNRVPAKHLASTGKCGACKAALPPIDAPLDVNDAATFDAIVQESQVPVLVDFWAAWCAPCQAAAPHVKKVAHDMAGRAVVVKVDTDRNGDIAARYDVRGIPNFVVLKAGAVVQQQAGMVDAATMSRWLT